MSNDHDADPMNDAPLSNHYLWDRSGDADPDVARLEETLSVFRHRPDARSTVEPIDRGRPTEPATRGGGRLSRLAAAALIAVAVGGAWTVGRRAQIVSEPVVRVGLAPGWGVSAVGGAPRVDGNVLTGDGFLAVGGRLVTDGQSSARVKIADIGRADIAPNSSVRLVSTRDDEHRLALDHGKLSAVVMAPPRLFLVETPSVLAVDLGCAYELEIDEEGYGLLRVTSGWVALERDGGETLVPAGSVCRIEPQSGSGIPRYESSPAEYVDLLDAVETGDVSSSTIDAVLATAPPGDTLSLWHVLFRVGAAERRSVVDAIAARETPPEDVDLAAASRLDREAIALWREDLHWAW